MNKGLTLLLMGGIYLFLAVAPLQAIPLGGDPVYDGKINLTDIIFLVNYIFKGGPAPQFPFTGNANEDCETNLQDIMVLVNFVFKGGAEPKGWDCSFDTVYSTELVGFNPFVTFDGNKLYYTNGYDLVYSEWDSTSNSWGLPINLGPNINTVEQDLAPSLTADQKKLYFTSYERAGGFGNDDIWMSEWDSVNNEWKIPINLGNTINGIYSDCAPFISYNQSQLYFSRLGDKIYVSNWNGDSWDFPNPLGENINYDGSEMWCCLTFDGETIYFVRWVVNDPFFGHPKIFVSHWTGYDWGTALKLGPPVNLPGEGTATPFITSDGVKLYFNTARAGQSEIWVATKK